MYGVSKLKSAKNRNVDECMIDHLLMRKHFLRVADVMKAILCRSCCYESDP